MALTLGLSYFLVNDTVAPKKKPNIEEGTHHKEVIEEEANGSTENVKEGLLGHQRVIIEQQLEMSERKEAGEVVMKDQEPNGLLVNGDEEAGERTIMLKEDEEEGSKGCETKEELSITKEEEQQQQKKKKNKRFDWLGSILVATGTAAFLFFINQVPTYGWISWPIVVTSLLPPPTLAS